MYGTMLERNSQATGYELQPQPKSVVNPQFHTRVEIERTLAALSVKMRADDGAIVRNRVTKCTNTLEP